MIRLTLATFTLLFGLFAALANDFVFTQVDVAHGLSDNQIRYILQLPDGRMVFTTNGNVNLYDGKSFSYIHRNAQHIFPLSNYNGHYRVYQSGDSLLWIKDNHKLSCLNLHTEKYISNIAKLFSKQGVAKPVEDLFVDDQQRMWLLVDGRLIHFSTSEIIELNNYQGYLQDVSSDNENIYLFYNTGVVVCYNIETKTERYHCAAYPAYEQHLFQKTSLVVKGKNGFYQLRNGSKGGFFFFNTERRTWEKILQTNYTLNTLILSPDETAYISCPHGFWVINPQNKDMQYLPILKTIKGNIIDTEISTLFLDKQGGLWLGTLNRGLLYYHPSRYKFTYIGRSYFPKESTKDITVQAFTEDKEGLIYVRCQSDIYKYHSSTEINKGLTPVLINSLPDDVQEKLFRNNLNKYKNKQYSALLTDIRGWTWAGTSDGLKLFQPNKKEEKTFYTDDGLCNNFIHALLEDRNKNIWVTTSYGISRIEVDSISKGINFINYNTLDGTLQGEYTDGAIFESKDGTLYFGGINGFNILKPDDNISEPLPFKPVFTNLFLRGEKVQIGKTYEDRIILNKATHYTHSIELSYHQNFLTFEFSAINYQNPHQTIYRYQLIGIDTGWNEISDSEQNKNHDKSGILNASYTNLPPGNYTFKVMATNNKSNWKGVITELKIIISAPWWKTTLAYALYITFLIIVLLVGIISYNRISRKRMERLHKEEILFIRIKNLIEQVNQLEAEKESFLSKSHPDNTSLDELNNLDFTDNAFLTKAIEQVEKNLDSPNYSVEQLSLDLCMERSGLYRKLITLLDKSPSLFIRHIRLQKAAQLIIEDQLSITEISEKVGFSSTSYLSKCFQESYGCRPSEYTQKMKKST
ncbi:MAG: helix-turn-helix domain-containing protein [Marinilabiliaceae bacterium]|nr:helix-turn-helix domain-containing protein [Marinilabiliaceae bacterium]